MTEIPEETRKAIEIAKDFSLGNKYPIIKPISPSTFVVEFPNEESVESLDSPFPKTVSEQIQNLHIEIEEVNTDENPKFVFKHKSA